MRTPSLFDYRCSELRESASFIVVSPRRRTASETRTRQNAHAMRPVVAGNARRTAHLPASRPNHLPNWHFFSSGALFRTTHKELGRTPLARSSTCMVAARLTQFLPQPQQQFSRSARPIGSGCRMRGVLLEIGLCEEFLGVERGHAAHARGGHGLPVDLVGDVAPPRTRRGCSCGSCLSRRRDSPRRAAACPRTARSPACGRSPRKRRQQRCELFSPVTVSIKSTPTSPSG